MIKIAIAGLIGYDAAMSMISEHGESLEKRFSRRFIRDVKELDKYNIDPKALEIPSGLVLPVERGGLWAALWKACDEWKAMNGGGRNALSGCRINLADIPVKQEIIEICELYDEDPYETPSSGAAVILWDEDDAQGNCRIITESCTVIGEMTGDRSRVLCDKDTVRYLTPPSRQEKDVADRKSYTGQNDRKLR